MAEPDRTRPRVVLFRPNPIDSDSRAKKFAETLQRLGYEAVVLSPVAPGEPTDERWLGQVRVVPVVVDTSARDAARAADLQARSRRFAIFATPGAQVEGTRGLTRLRRRAQGFLDRQVHASWRRRALQRTARTSDATVANTLPEVNDYERAFMPALRDLDPDVVHAHHPFVLPTATAYAKERANVGRVVRVLYDAREYFAGLPVAEHGNPRRQAMLLRTEESIRQADAVSTVSEPIADALMSRYGLAARPTVILNLPWDLPSETAAVRSVRDAAGLSADVPLLLYSGAVSRARGLDTLLAAMKNLPEAHLAVVTVPFPHPQMPALLEAVGAEVAGRIHVLPPVSQDELPGYLSGADVGVHPMPGGSLNHDMALPNKLFEYVHAGLPLVVSDARAMADFVTEHGLGAVFRSEDPDDLARAVREVLANPGLRDEKHLRELAARYSWQHQQALIGSLYRDLAPLD